MKSSAKSKSKKEATLYRLREYAPVIVILVLVIILIGVVGVFKSINSAKTRTKVQARQVAQEIDTSLTANGSLIYDKIKDQGCGPEQTSWLQTQTSCTYSLQKIYRSTNASAETDLRALEKKIIAGGWEREAAFTCISGG